MEQVPNLADDLIVGAEEIARALGWVKNGRPMARRVHHLAEKGKLPIHKVDGLGLVARRSSLARHFSGLDAEFWEASSGETNGIRFSSKRDAC